MNTSDTVTAHECEVCAHFDSKTSRCPHLPIVPVVGGCEHWRRHIPGMVARVEGEGGTYTVYDLGAKSYADETAMIALAAMRDLTGMDFTRIIKAMLREAAYRPGDMPF